MGATSKTQDSHPDARLHRDARPVVADKDDPTPAKPPARPVVTPGAGGPFPPPGPPAAEPHVTRAPSGEEVAANKEMADTQNAVSALLEERLKLASADQSKVSELEQAISKLADSAKKGAAANLKDRTEAYDEVLSGAKPGVTVDVSELAQNLADAKRLIELAADIPPEQVLRGLAQIADMPAQAELRHLCVKTMALLDPRLKPAERQKLIGEIKVIEEKATKFANTATIRWSGAENASKNGSVHEAKACADGHQHAQEFEQMVQAQVKLTNQYLKKYASAGSDAAKGVQQQFHKDAEELLRMAADNRRRLAHDFGEEIANDDQREANARADDEKREQERSARRDGERKHTLHEQQQARANTTAADETYAQHRTRTAAEVAKHDGTPPRKFG